MALIAVRTTHRAVVSAAYRPFHSGGRFSKNAFTPSWMS